MEHVNSAPSRHPFGFSLSGYGLKMVGIVLMVIDHLYEMFYPFGIPLVFHMIGRACMPIFLFMAAEGFHYTRNRGKYLLRLLVGFWFMGVCNLLLGRLMPLDDVVLMNNVFGTMFLSAFYMWMIELFKSGVKDKKPRSVILAVLGSLAPIASSLIIITVINSSLLLAQTAMVMLPAILLTEGGFSSVILAVLFFLLRRHGHLVQMIPLVLLSVLSAIGGGIQWMMVFAAIPLLLYNGQAGRKSKWFFYIFYPAHIYVFYILSYFLH